jgi:hypothetical protein
VSSDSTAVSGCRDRQAAHDVIATGRIANSMPLPRSGPDTGRPVNWFHRLSVRRSNISLLERYSRPDEPNTNGSP